MSFNILNLITKILTAISQPCFILPTPTQQQVISFISVNHWIHRDAPKSIGKTDSFILPTLPQLSLIKEKLDKK